MFLKLRFEIVCLFDIFTRFYFENFYLFSEEIGLKTHVSHALNLQHVVIPIFNVLFNTSFNCLRLRFAVGSIS